METITRNEAARHKAGGIASLYIAIALLIAMPYFLLAVDYLGAENASEKVALVVTNYASMYTMHLVTYVFYGIALVVLAFALYHRLQACAPATMQPSYSA